MQVTVIKCHLPHNIIVWADAESIPGSIVLWVHEDLSSDEEARLLEIINARAQHWARRDPDTPPRLGIAS